MLIDKGISLKPYKKMIISDSYYVLIGLEYKIGFAFYNIVFPGMNYNTRNKKFNLSILLIKA